MAKVRTRVKRSFLLVLALCVLALLLELNRFLPGTWPGGGGGGFQAASVAGSGDPRPDRPREPDHPDPATVMPPETPPEQWPPREGLHIELRGPDGELETRWRLGAGRGERADVEPDSQGVVRSRDAKIYEDGFRVRTHAGVFRHGHGLQDPAAKWVVLPPSAKKLPLQRPAGRAGVRVVDRTSGKPIEGAAVRWIADGQEGVVKSDATGEAVLPGSKDGRLIHVGVEVPGRGIVERWVSPRDAEAAVIEMQAFIEVGAKMMFPPGLDLTKVDACIVVPDGSSMLREYRLERPTKPGSPPFARIPQGSLENAWLLATVGTGNGDYIVRHRVRETLAEYDMPAPRRIKVRVRDQNGKRVKDVVVEAYYPALEAEEGLTSPREAARPMPGISGPTGVANIVVPAGVPVRLHVQVPGARPIVRALTSVDGNDELEFVAEPGLEVPVRVLAADGKPLQGAQLAARATTKGLRVHSGAPTGPEGRATLGPFAEGPVEIFATADGHAWKAVLVEAAPAMGTVEIRLVRGFPLRIVVEDPFGVPLESVEVTITPADGGTPLPAPPDGGPMRTNEKGLLVVSGLPNRYYNVGLSRSGHTPETLRRLQPGAVTYFATLVRRR